MFKRMINKLIDWSLEETERELFEETNSKSEVHELLENMNHQLELMKADQIRREHGDRLVNAYTDTLRDCLRSSRVIQNSFSFEEFVLENTMLGITKRDPLEVTEDDAKELAEIIGKLIERIWLRDIDPTAKRGKVKALDVTL